MKSLRRAIAWISMMAFVLGYLIQPVSIYADAAANDTVSIDVDIQDGTAVTQPMDGVASPDGGVDSVEDEDMDSNKVVDDSGAFEPTDSESTLVEGSSTSGGAGANEEIPVEPDVQDENQHLLDAGENAPGEGILVQAHVSNLGWLDPVEAGKTAGSDRAGNALEALRVAYSCDVPGGIEASLHVSNLGWQPWTAMDGTAYAGTVGKSQAVEAVKIKLTGEAAQSFDLYYRVCGASGWSGWAKNGEPAGSQGFGRKLYGVQVALVASGSSAPGSSENAFIQALVGYSAHVADIGWMGQSRDGEIAGTTGRALQLEALRFSLLADAGGAIEARAHVSNIGWQGWSTGSVGTTGRNLAVEAICMRLTGEAAQKYDIWYRVHSAEFGWLGWASNGDPAGSQGYGRDVQAIQVVLVEKGSAAPGPQSNAFKAPVFEYGAHSAEIGWRTGKEYSPGAHIVLGTTGRGLSLQAIRLSCPGIPDSGSIVYASHVSNIGWQGSVRDGATSGTTGRNLPIEAVKISLTGSLADRYDVWYRVHVANIGWLDWACNGDAAGSEGLAASVEAVEVCLVSKGAAAPGSTGTPFIQTPQISYSGNVEGSGWQTAVSTGSVCGTVGQSKALKGLRVTYGSSSLQGGISYRVHVSNKGWLSMVSDGADAGAANESLQAVAISLTGQASKHFDVWYRVHVEKIGWLGWTSNGAVAGTTSCNLSVQAVQIQLRAKGAAAPGSTTGAYYAAVGSLPYIGYQTPGSYYKVSNKSVSIKNQGSGIFGYRTESRIPFDATRMDCVNAMITRAMDYLNTPYIWDYSCAPGVGVDCAGLVMQSLYACGMDLSPMNPWDHYYTPGHDQYANQMRASSRFMHVSFESRQPGDLILSSGHVSIYLGNDKIIEAFSPRVGVRIASVYNAKVLAVARPMP